MSKRRSPTDEALDNVDKRQKKLPRKEQDQSTSTVRTSPSTETRYREVTKTRILSWNIETPVPFLDLSPSKLGISGPKVDSRPSHLRELLSRHDFPDFLCLQEVRARQSDKEWIAALTRAVNGFADSGARYAIYTSLNRATRGQRHFGTATFVKDPDAIAVAREVDWDSEGRCIILEMKSDWALVNVYALNGSEYLWKDPLGKGIPKTRNERKREFNRLLLDEVQKMQARGLRVVLIGDFNISLTKKDCVPRLRTEFPHALARKEFNEIFIPGADVVDIYRKLHGDKPGFSWFAKGVPQGSDCARVDYALVESALCDHVIDIQYLEDPKERGHSDHSPLLLTLRDLDIPKQPDIPTSKSTETQPEPSQESGPEAKLKQHPT